MLKCLGSIASALLWTAVAGWAAPSGQQRSEVLVVNASHSARLSYLLFLPASYPKESATRWPLILYLHGGSLRGDNIDELRSAGLTHKLESEPDFPCVVVSPQCPAGEIWTDVDAMGALLDHVEHEYRIDPERIYVTGHSMGGRGALYFAYRMPGRFAAVLALSPYSAIEAWAQPLAHLPLWLFHGEADATVPITETRALVHAVERAGGHPRFTVLEQRDHFILDVYERPEIYEWLLAQRKAGTESLKP